MMSLPHGPDAGFLDVAVLPPWDSNEWSRMENQKT